MSHTTTVQRASAFTGAFSKFTDDQLADLRTRLVYALGRVHSEGGVDAAVLHKADATLGRLVIEQRVRNDA